MKLKDILDIQTGLLSSRKKHSKTNETPKQYQVLTLKAIQEDGSIDLEAIKKEDFRGMNEKYLTKENDILIKTFAPFPATYITKDLEGFVVPSYFLTLRITNEKFSPRYIKEFLNSRTGKRQILARATSTTMKTIKAKEIREIEITEVSLERQEKIVTAATLMRDEISLLKELLALKENNAKKLINSFMKGEENG